MIKKLSLLMGLCSISSVLFAGYNGSTVTVTIKNEAVKSYVASNPSLYNVDNDIVNVAQPKSECVTIPSSIKSGQEISYQIKPGAACQLAMQLAGYNTEIRAFSSNLPENEQNPVTRFARCYVYAEPGDKHPPKCTTTVNGQHITYTITANV